MRPSSVRVFFARVASAGLQVIAFSTSCERSVRVGKGLRKAGDGRQVKVETGKNPKRCAQRHRRGDESANLGAIVFFEAATEDPSFPEGEHSDEIRIVIVGQDTSCGRMSGV
jgi:hypothetical protein